MTPRRFLPPIAGGAQKTGWEALEKWVGSGSGAAAASDAPADAARGRIVRPLRQDRLGGPGEVGRLRLRWRGGRCGSGRRRSGRRPAPPARPAGRPSRSGSAPAPAPAAAAAGRRRGRLVRPLRQDRLGGPREVGRLRLRRQRRPRTLPRPPRPAPPARPAGRPSRSGSAPAPAAAGAAEAPAAAAPASSGPSGKTGWEALDKWVGDGSSTPSTESSAANGAAAEPVAAGASAGSAPASGGGLMGFLKRLFGGK